MSINGHLQACLRSAVLITLPIVLAACGGGGVKVPDGVVIGGPAPSPTPTCTDPNPSVTASARFNTQDAGAGTLLSSNALTACFPSTRATGVRSTAAIEQGPNSFYYFEAKRSGNVGIGVGTATSSLVSNNTAADDIFTTEQSVAVRGTLAESDRVAAGANAFIGSVPRDEYIGFAVDYRGVNPVVYVLASADSARTGNLAQNYCSQLSGAGSACVVSRHELPRVTTPLFIYAFGRSEAGTPDQVTINTGESLDTVPFQYPAARLLEGLYSRYYATGDGLRGFWTGNPSRALPEVTLVSGGRRAAVKVGDTSPSPAGFTVAATDATDGNLAASIRWVNRNGTEVGSGPTLAFNATLISTLGTGTHRLRAIATNSTRAFAAQTFELVVLAAGDTGDVDGDGLSYDAEKLAGTNPADPDTDGDGLADDVEAGFGFNPLLADTNGDGTRDGRQLATASGVAGAAGLSEKVVLRREAGPTFLRTTSRSVLMAEDGLRIALAAGLNNDCVLQRGAFQSGIYEGAAYTPEMCGKRAIRGSQGIAQGEFRYFEITHFAANVNATTGPNIGHGLINAEGAINPYCCLSSSATAADPRTPPSMSLNPASGMFNRLSNAGVNTFAGFDRANTLTIGFAVDYRGADPVVYFITTDGAGGPSVMAGTTTVTGLAGQPIYPMVYGDPLSDNEVAAEINFGLKRFFHGMSNVRALLTSPGGLAAPDVSANFRPGVGIHRRPNS